MGIHTFLAGGDRGTDREQIGNIVGKSVGNIVGESVGNMVGNMVRRSSREWLGTQSGTPAGDNKCSRVAESYLSTATIFVYVAFIPLEGIYLLVLLPN